MAMHSPLLRPACYSTAAGVNRRAPGERRAKPIPAFSHRSERTMLIRLDQLPDIPRPDNDLVMKHVVDRDRHSPDLSITWVKIDGRHRRLASTTGDRVYYVIEGSGRFQVGDGAPWVDAGAGDFVFIPKDVPYELEGELVYLVINGPAFGPGSDRYLES